ncbi:MAG: ABC transporter ATP-binding protein [Sedimentisphaerales bacterium]|nr:ABC transporter ATP-binding protein [Sedimentisphaerales bacterium]
MSETVVKIDGLVKYYGGRRVLNGIDLEVKEGCIYGLLGRNGVGKTTIIRILMGLDFATRGSTSLFGVDSGTLSPGERGRIGYVAEGHHLIGGYKVSALAALCKGLALRWNEEMFGKVMAMFNLPMNRKVKELSTGMRAQLNLALAMAVDPELLILDDPTLGLDTIARRQFLELAIDLIQRDGKTILFSSHILSDVERIADRVGVLVQGKLVVDCGLDELKTRVKKLQVVFADDSLVDLHMTDVIRAKRSGRELVLTVANWCEQKQALLDTYRPEVCREVPMTLEDIFVEITG